MSDDGKTQSPDNDKPEEKTRRLTLNKRVIKHLVVKSNVKTGLSAYCSDDACGPTAPGTRCCTNHNAAKVLRRR